MEETYTFSRALHLMRYGGKFLGLYGSDSERFYVKDNVFFRSIRTNGEWDYGWKCNGLPDSYIMGEWVEVKE